MPQTILVARISVHLEETDTDLSKCAYCGDPIYGNMHALMLQVEAENNIEVHDTGRVYCTSCRNAADLTSDSTP